MISIRRRLTRELLGAVLLLLGGGLAILFFAARDAAIEQFDSALQAKARAISTVTLQEGGVIRVAFSDRFLPGFDDRKPRDFFQLWDAAGREIARSESLAAGSQLPHGVGTLARPRRENFTLPNGRPGRLVGFAFRPKSAGAPARGREEELQLVVASDRDGLDETLWQLGGLCAGLGAVLAGVTVWLIPRVLRRGLEPLDRLGERVTRIDADSLATRFSLDDLPAELRPIGGRLNELLGRLQESFERERRFSADLAHELRTPLAELRSSAECALKWPEARDPATDRETLAITLQMERIVTHLLALARGEQGQLAVQPEPIALDVLVGDLWPEFASRAAARELTATLDLQPARGLADGALLRAILNNLFENAVDYASRQGEILISARSGPTGVTVTVANTAEELRPEDLPRLFDRFWRKEAARTGGAHLGLGLALSRSFAAAMGWTLTAEFDAAHRLAFVLAGPSPSPGAANIVSPHNVEVIAHR